MRRTQRAFTGLLLPILFIAAAGMFDPAAAQQHEKRIALVIGNGAYAKSPLPTAANDAGLIAQTLQAAGFDVAGARDLDDELLRKSLRDFIQKVQTSGPETVAMIYLAGYGVQLAGENYFIPVDSSISRDADIPTEALRISDYVRQLAAIPLKANIIVLDVARQQPFIGGGQPVASGLALVKPEANTLIAFNAAPGTVAPSEVGPFGVYAQSLAEMIRTGGLSLPEVFDRVRLRVSDASKGTQIPWNTSWNAQKASERFTFFERRPGAPPLEGAPDQVAAFRGKPIRDLSPQDAYAAAIERDTLPAYEEFLAAYPDDPQAKRVRAIIAARREAITWQQTFRADTPEAYWSYLHHYPHGPHAADARQRLAILNAPIESPPNYAMFDYDVVPPLPEELIYIDQPVLVFNDPDFEFVPPPPSPVFILPPPTPDFVNLPPPIVSVDLFVLPQVVFVPFPLFVRPPANVVPPPNNLVFRNIHNTAIIKDVIKRPPAVARRASLIQQGKLPLPPSASINPTAKPGTATRANVVSRAAPRDQTRLPLANALPVARGTSPAGRATLQTPALRGRGGPGASTKIPKAHAKLPTAAAPLAFPQPTVAGHRGNRMRSTNSPPLTFSTGRPTVTSVRPGASPPAIVRERIMPRDIRSGPPPAAVARPVPPPPSRPQATARPISPSVRVISPPPPPPVSPTVVARPVSPPPVVRQPPPLAPRAAPQPVAKRCSQPRC